MEASEELLTIAELAIGLAGFSGVVVAFNRGEGLRPTDRFRFIAMFTAALSVLVVSFVPFGFHHAGTTGPALWMGSSAVQLASWVSIFLVLGVRFRPEFGADEQLTSWVSLPLYGLSGLIPILQVANIIGWPMEPGPLFYLAGLILWLVGTSFLFALLVVFGARK
jgi:hypothetical protein